MIKEVLYSHPDFHYLCEKLEKEHQNVIAEQRWGNGNCLNNLEKFIHVYIYYEDEKPVGSLAISRPINNIVEIGRVFVEHEYRNRKIASKLFNHALLTIQNENYDAIELNTYQRFKSAVHIYKKLGFEIVEPFDFIKDSKYSVCMRKKLKP